MTDLTRVSSGRPREDYEASTGPDPTLDEQGLLCRSPNPTSPELELADAQRALPAGARQLVERFSSPMPTTSNAQRTSAREASSYVETGVTSNDDALYAGVAALKGRTPSGVEVEYLSASVQAGGENEAQTALARVGVSGKRGSAGLEVFSARVAGGAHNEDGSSGINSSAQVTAFGVEGTLRIGAGSVTFGASLGLGAAVSVGVKDADSDGNPEFCGKLSMGPVTLGACVED